LPAEPEKPSRPDVDPRPGDRPDQGLPGRPGDPPDRPGIGDPKPTHPIADPPKETDPPDETVPPATPKKP